MTKICTNYSNEVFTNCDNVHVTVRVEKSVDDRVMVGLVVADKLDQCGSYTCGDKEIDGSIGCGIVDGELILRKGDRSFFRGKCDTNDPTDIHMSYSKGKLSFRIGRGQVNSDELSAMTLTGRFRLGVSVVKEGQVASITHCSKEAPDTLLSACVHRDVLECVVAFFTVPTQACARRASKTLWKAITATSMEDMLRATVVVQEDTRAVDAQLVVLAMSRAPFSSADALVAWCGGLELLYDELPKRFPHAAAIGISARLAAIRPFPFASGCATMTMCIVTAVASAPSVLVVESVVLGVHNATSVNLRALSHNGEPSPILCLEGATPVQFPNLVHDALLSSLPSLRTIWSGAFYECESLQSISLANLPHLESIGFCAFGDCARLSSVDLSDLPSLRSIGGCAFRSCKSLQSISLANLPCLESISYCAFPGCAHLSSVNLSDLPSLRSIGACAFQSCESLQSISLANLPCLESIGDDVFSSCVHLSSVNLSDLPSLRSIDEEAFAECSHLSSVDLSVPSLCSIRNGAFQKCSSLQSVSLANLLHLECIGDSAFAECASLSTVDLSDLPSLLTIGKSAFQKCGSFQSISLANLPRLESIGDHAFAECVHLSTVDLSVPSLRSIGNGAFQSCESLQSISLANLPCLESIGDDAFAECADLSTVSFSDLRVLSARVFLNNLLRDEG